MKAYFLTETQIAGIIRHTRDESYKYNERLYVSNDSDLAKQITEAIDGITPIEIDDVTIREIDVPCKFYPMANIVGLSQNEGYLKGVFVKE